MSPPQKNRKFLFANASQLQLKSGHLDSAGGGAMNCMCRFSTADRIVVWSVRTWGWDRSSWRCVERHLGESLGAADGQSLSRSLYGLCCLIGRSATRAFVLPPLECRRVSEDERMLVGALAEAQRDNWPLATAFLEDFLPPDCLRYAFHPIASAAEIFGRAGHEFTPQSGLPMHGAADAAQPIASH